MEGCSKGVVELLFEGKLGAVTLGLEQGLFSRDELDLPHSSDGSTPLISACQMGLTMVMQFLLDKGVDTTVCNHSNKTALHVSPRDLQEALLAALVRPICHKHHLLEAAWRGDINTVHLLTQTDLVDVNSQNQNGLTSLMLAVRDVDLFEGLQDIMPWDYQPSETVKALLALSASIGVQDLKGYTALHYISQLRSCTKNELLQMILESQSVSTNVEPELYLPEDCSVNTLSCAPLHNLSITVGLKDVVSSYNTAVQNRHKDSSQDKITYFIQTSMEPKRNTRRGFMQMNKPPGWTSLPNLRDRNKFPEKLGPLHCASDIPSLIPIPPRLNEKKQNIPQSPSVPDFSHHLSQSAPSLALLDAGVLTQVRTNVYNRLSSGESDDNGQKGAPTILCPRTPKHLAPLDREYHDVPVLSGLQRPLLLKPIGILPASSLSRQRRERFSRFHLRGTSGRRGGSAESASSSCSSGSSLDFDEEEVVEEGEVNGPQKLQHMFCTLEKEPQNTLASPLFSEHLVNSEKTDIVEHANSNMKDEPIENLRHDSAADSEQRDSADFIKMDKLAELVKSFPNSDEQRGVVSVVKPADENDEHITSSVEQRKCKKTGKSKDRKCNLFHTNQSFNILAYRNTNWGTVKPKRNRRNSSISAQAKSKNLNPTDQTTNKYDCPRMALSISQKPKDAALTHRSSSELPNQVQLSRDTKAFNKCESQKQLLSQELKSARQPKKLANLGTLRARSALDSVSYSDMFLQIQQGDTGPAIFEMFATPIYENLRVGSSTERNKQVQPASQAKKPQIGQRAQKSTECNRRKQPPKCSHAKGKPRKRRGIQPVRPVNLAQTVENINDKAFAVSGLDGNGQDIFANEEDRQDTGIDNKDRHMLSVIKEDVSCSTSRMLINQEQRGLSMSPPSALPPFLSRQVVNDSPKGTWEASGGNQDSVEDEFPARPMINTWTSDRTRSPVYQKFLDEVGEGPVTDDLLRCLAEELISLEEKEVETLKPEHSEDQKITDKQEIKVLKVPHNALNSHKIHCSEKSSISDAISWTRGEVLGRGAYGTVYCGLTSQGQLIAVKQVLLDASTSETAESQYNRLEREVDLLKNLNHPNIILEGVAYLHDNRVIHRDLKGNNIMLMPTGVVKLIDFGCARRLNRLTHSGGHSDLLKSVHGTPYWMAPEVINETGHGRKSDIWSIGCTVFEMATGKPPLAHMGKIAALFYIGARKGLMPELPDDFSEEAKHFVNACLTSNQRERPSAGELLRHPFILHYRQPKSSKPCSNSHHLSHQTNGL
ncbi:mitogen-activated protein kinase kinase kinase 19 isoform X2 [Hoplias malabaricus]|uniref:mitogen-activated protein kinase kinase kinase 19 isoform X2 n=1 Tax=Hoplias malabaricus TaxID=27720 RepID=UPI0034625F06